MQKYGLLRIYSTRLGYGNAKVEKYLVIFWMLTIAAWLARRYGPTALDGLSHHFALNFLVLTTVVDIIGRWIYYPILATAVVITLVWLRDEVRHYHPRNIPKLLYVGSMGCILLTGYYSAVIGFCIIAINHSIEYVTLVSLYGKHRTPLQSWIRNPVTVNLICLPGALVLLLSLSLGSPQFYLAYTLFNTYLHQTYDRLIWKVREPQVREALLAIGR
jgi:hypothetical protein